MSSAGADRNLLVGILALQMEFIDREQLIAALRAWFDEKSKSLDAVLIEQGAIDVETKSVLAALVDKHIQMHAGDATLSLAALRLEPAIQQKLAELGDDDVDRTIAFASGTKDARARADAGASTVEYLRVDSPHGLRFRVLRMHDRGGIGTVSVAMDGELNREVALKEIQERYASDEAARERFTLEAEVTGGLEHPGIVPVYGFGHYDDGRPFYAMRFIRGDNLRSAIRRYHDRDLASAGSGDDAVEFRRLLGHLVDVCHAIQYAHCRGVLHRDLKPSNIMLGKYGETLVVDWGLAKTSLRPESTPLTNEAPLKPVYSSGTDQTRQGTHLGTPAYMSPEQAVGRLDLVDARSDVYSLGVTLYEILTGKRAFQDDPVETILAKVRRGDFIHPRKLNPQVPPALAAICVKAMQLPPEGRYESAAALAEDIEHWLADEPVTAWNEPFALRARRWVKRHRILVTSSAAALVAALVILTVAVGLLNAAKNREARERQRAEENLSLAKQAVDVMLTEVASEELENVPQMEATRSILLAKARDFYGKFRDQTPSDPGLQLEAALANKRLGDILRMMGDVDASQKSYALAVRLLESLHAQFPEQAQYQQQLANANNYLGVLYKKFDRGKALETYNRTIVLQSDLVDRFPDNPVYRQELARSHYNRGILRTADASQAGAAANDFLTAIRQLQQVIDEQQDAADLAGCRQELARCFSNLAILQRQESEISAARQNYQQAIDITEPLAAEFPEKREYQKELALYYNNLTNLLVAQAGESDIEAARASNEQSLTIYEHLSAAVPEVRSDLGNIHHSRGVILARLGQNDEALAQFQMARATFEPLVAEFADFPIYRDRLGNSFYELAKLQYAAAKQASASDDTTGAREMFETSLQLAERAVDCHKQLVERHPEDSTYGDHLRSDYFLEAWTLKMLYELDSEQIGHAATIETADSLAASSPDNADHLKLAAELCAISSALVEQATDLDESQQQASSDEYAARAITLLHSAIDKGYGDTAGLREELQQAATPDSVFHALHGRPGLDELEVKLANGGR